MVTHSNKGAYISISIEYGKSRKISTISLTLICIFVKVSIIYIVKKSLILRYVIEENKGD